jgi:acetyl esterase/lipase
VSTRDTQDALASFFKELGGWVAQHAVPSETLRYGPHPDQELDLRVPPGPGPHRLAIVLHGGFWRAPFTRANTTALATGLSRAGWATANVEYRRLGPGAYRAIVEDVLAARARLADADRIDARRAVALGHSAGGHLALWLAAEGGAAAVAALAGVSDLTAAARRGVGADAVVEFLGGDPEALPGVYGELDPARRLPLGVPQLLVHGTQDDRVPLELSREYEARARAAGDDCRLLELPGADHFDVIDPRHASWAVVLDGIAALVPTAQPA